jgi:hypothetical protein
MCILQTWPFPAYKQFKAARQGNRRGYGIEPLLLSLATTNVSHGNWTTRWPIWDVAVLLDCEWKWSLTCLLPHVHFNLGTFTHYDNTAYKMCEMSLHSKTRCLQGILYFHLLCSPCASWINISDISQQVWLCIATAVCTWETYPKCLQKMLCTVFFTVLNSWLSHLRGFFWLLVKNFWPWSIHSCDTVGLSYIIPQM